MDPNTFPTKGNLILAKNSLVLSKQGYELMDKKRNILIRELMDLIDKASDIQKEIDTTFSAAYEALQMANIENGISTVAEIAATVPVENSIKIKREEAQKNVSHKYDYRRTALEFSSGGENHKLSP